MLFCGPLGEPDMRRRMEHEPLEIPPREFCLQVPLRLAPPAVIALTMRHVALLEAQAAGLEPPHATAVLALDDAHQFCGHCAVVVWDPERVPRDGVLLAKDAEVDEAHARPLGGRGEDRVSRWVKLVRVGGEVAEVGEVVLVRAIPPVPGNNVKGGVRLGVLIESAGELGDDAPVGRGRHTGERLAIGRCYRQRVKVDVEAGHRVLEVADMS